RSRLSSQLASRIDPEDVVQSAYRSFFCGAREGRYDFQRGGDLWHLLVAITLHKLRDQVKHHTSDKRNVQAENRTEGPADALASERGPVEAMALVEELEGLMRTLSPPQRRMVELRLQGQSVPQIATATQFTQRTVRRILERVRQHLEQQQV